ncbi:hypothetical protein Adt_07456 [Abeliophyllum distichum]|uniref:Uncharacterized protein n=1 Tax=Abeliophyllum distichum TaxID=126358 RepID=A0ABD1V9S8_9LAMI
MAGVMSHEGDGAGNLPQQPLHRLASTCESVRFIVPPCYPSWTEVLEEQRARLRNIIESYFDLHGDHSPDEYRMVCAAVDRLAADRYRDYKIKAHNHLKRIDPADHTARCLSRTSRSALTSSPVLLSWETQHTQVASSGALLDERAIAKEVLGKRRGHVRGVGRVLKGTSPSLYSTVASKVPQGTFHQFSGDPRITILDFPCTRLSYAECSGKLCSEK